jgi:hypothetical protein
MAVSIGAAATMRTIEDLRDAVLDALRAHTSVELDCSAVTEADLSFIQLLDAARKFAAREGRSLHVTGPISPVLSALARRCGFAGDDDAAWNAFWPAGATEQ